MISYTLLKQKPPSARILIRKGKMDSAKAVMSKIYALATPQQISLKVAALHSAVRRSVEIADSTTFAQRIGMTFLNPVNRRAVSK